MVFAAYTPSGNVNPHQPMLKGKGELAYIVARAKTSQMIPNAHMSRDTKIPQTYAISPATGGRVLKFVKSSRVTFPRYKILT